MLDYINHLQLVYEKTSCKLLLLRMIVKYRCVDEAPSSLFQFNKVHPTNQAIFPDVLQYFASSTPQSEWKTEQKFIFRILNTNTRGKL